MQSVNQRDVGPNPIKCIEVRVCVCDWGVGWVAADMTVNIIMWMTVNHQWAGVHQLKGTQ